MKNVVFSTRDIDDFVCDIANEVIRKIDLWYGSDTLRQIKPNKDHFTKREAASELSCSVPMIDKLIQQGRLDKVKVGAKVLIPREGIERILNNKKGANYAK